ncbi:hypothetical protein CATRI_11005 [Corynebacterium atrinae]|uniref:MmcQ/YjbR family DNA-binding protein n=1 Tax=Corynebacterium atrinae TaxID=1336740 RepID=UPI0025B5CFC5|nr:MmcQ/YjbR family DNA-binding protein [Corynebacterium atrinae]WJY64252.1 hypothetical protein CATRI_11005 [Corynebacterium atrinae]
MDDRIQRQAAARAGELPGAYLDHPFGPDWDVFKVREKVFMLQTKLHGKPLVTLKADPSVSQLLRSSHQSITPGYHMNKKHWITLHPGGDLDRQFVEDLVTESYLLVIERNLPKSRWPVDPATFGR